MEYKLIASDLDETLLNDDHVVPESNIYWIQNSTAASRKSASASVPNIP